VQSFNGLQKKIRTSRLEDNTDTLAFARQNRLRQETSVSGAKEQKTNRLLTYRHRRRIPERNFSFSKESVGK
jgi:hypothetical protein